MQRSRLKPGETRVTLMKLRNIVRAPNFRNSQLPLVARCPSLRAVISVSVCVPLPFPRYMHSVRRCCQIIPQLSPFVARGGTYVSIDNQFPRLSPTSSSRNVFINTRRILFTVVRGTMSTYVIKIEKKTDANSSHHFSSINSFFLYKSFHFVYIIIVNNCRSLFDNSVTRCCIQRNRVESIWNG